MYISNIYIFIYIYIYLNIYIILNIYIYRILFKNLRPVSRQNTLPFLPI